MTKTQTARDIATDSNWMTVGNGRYLHGSGVEIVRESSGYRVTGSANDGVYAKLYFAKFKAEKGGVR